MAIIIPRNKKIFCKIIQCPDFKDGKCNAEECTIPDMAKALKDREEAVTNG